MNLRGWATFVVCAGVVALLAGCTGRTALTPELPLSVKGEVPFAVEGRDYRVVERIPSILDGRTLGYEGTTSDGTQILVRGAEHLDRSLPDDPRGTAMLTRDPKTGKTTVFSQHGTPGHWLQATGTTVTGNLVAWIETPSTSLYELPWELYSYDVSTKVEKHLASSDFFGIDNPPPPWMEGIVPLIHGNHVYFPAVDEVRDTDPAGRGRSSIYRVPLTGGDPELVAEGGIEVFDDLDGKLQIRSPERLARWDPAQGPDGEVPGTSLSTGGGAFANSGTTVTSEDSDIRITSPGREDITIEVGDLSRYYYNATNRWASFTVDHAGEQQGYIVDLERRTLLALKDDINSSTTRLHGNLYDYTRDLAWGEKPPKTYPLIALLPENTP